MAEHGADLRRPGVRAGVVVDPRRPAVGVVDAVGGRDDGASPRSSNVAVAASRSDQVVATWSTTGSLLMTAHTRSTHKD
ncbi:hypothetical protein BRD13_05210 [Halobacteriales archaeon SW_5_70_135]|nr:MAG: hypothetical protein BRD13_05210 [Halobacteriales archaeon SW_5_70_135]